MSPASLPDHLSPARALLHPAWLGALTVLAVNDHVLKGAGLLPAMVTGKLSDFAGLLVAPALLAALTGVRGRRGWLAAHLAVGAVFTAIQLSTVAAAWWSAVMAAVAMPWAIVCDPTDLVALPMLVVSHRVLGRAMGVRPRRLLERSAQLAAASVGMLCCIATSPPPEPVVFQDLFGTIYLHNESDEAIVVRIRPLREDVELDCGEVGKDPGRLLTEPLFGRARSWTVAADANLTVLDEDAPRRPCHAAWVDADDLPPAVLFWKETIVAESWIPGQGIDPVARGWVSIELDDDGQRTLRSQLDIVFTPTETPATGEICAPRPVRDRIDWSDRPVGAWTLLAVDAGVDGCLALDLGIGSVEDPGLTERIYLCVPSGSFPFAPGDRVDVSIPGGFVGTEVLVLSRSSAEDEPGLSMLVARGRRPLDPELLGLELAYRPDYECAPSVDAACGTVARPVEVLVGGPGFEAASLRPGLEPLLLESETRTVELWIPWAEERLALVASCERGSDELGLDVELVAVVEDL